MSDERDAESVRNPLMEMCPKCGDPDFEAYEERPTLHGYISSCQCKKCGHLWTDITARSRLP